MKLLLANSFIIFIIMCLAACGFHLRGQADVPFNSVNIIGNTLIISKELNKTFALNKVNIVNGEEQPDLQLDLLGEESEKRILSISSAGTINEFELYYRVHYRYKQSGSTLWSKVQTVEARRDFTFSESNRLAKQAEERQLNKNMHSDVINGIFRRLSALKPKQ